MTSAPLPSDPASRAFRRFRAEGHPAAVTEVFDLVGGELYALAAHLTRGGGEAEDLVQETFLVALARAGRFDERRAVTPWLVGILVKEPARQRRRAARAARGGGQQPAPPEPVAAVLSDEVRASVTQALAELPQRYREVLAPVLVDGVAPGALAVQLGRAPGTVRAQLHRGLELLRRALPESLAPAVIATFTAALTGERGLAAVRAEVARAAAARGAALAAGAASTPLWTSLGILTVSTKTAVALLCVAALVLATAFVRSAQEDVSPAAIDPAARAVEAPPPPLEAVPPDGPSTARAAASPATPIPFEAPQPAAARVVLRGQLLGVQSVPVEGLTLCVRAGMPARILTNVPVSGDGPFVVDLTEHLPAAAVGAARVDPQVSVLLIGAGYAESSGWARPRDDGRAQELTLAVTVEARPILRTLRGRVLAEGGAELSRSNLVEFVAEGAERAPTAVFPSTRVGVDGSFTLELPVVAAGTLVVAGQGHGVLHIPVGEDQLGDVDLGDLTVPRGASIAGRAVARAGPFARSTYALARAQLAPASWTERALGLQASEGRVHHAEARATLAPDGTFELVGLEPGLQYALFVVPARVAGRATSSLDELDGGTVVTAPAAGIQLEESLVAVQVIVKSGGAPVAGAEVRRALEGGDPRAEVPEALRGRAPKVARNGSAVLLLAPQGVTTLRVSAPNHDSADIAVEPAALSADEDGLLGPVLVELSGPAALAVVDWHIAAPVPDGARLGLRAITDAGRMVFLGPEPLVAGRARFAGAPVGRWDAVPFLVLPSSLPYTELPFGLEHSAALPVETRSGEATSVESQVVLGGRIELALLGRDPLLAAPAVLLVQADGNEVLPELIVPDNKGHRSVVRIETDGPIALGRAVPAGEYTMRVRGDAYEPSELRVTVRPGEVTRATVDLVRRRPSEGR